MVKVCAFMSLYNEEDVIEEVIKKLIANGVDIFILDNGCTDETINIAGKYLGKGVIDIFYFITEEDGRKVFKVEDILNQFEIAARNLNYDWYLISDADEIKYSPWDGLSLSEGISRVDAMGYNLIHFKLFDFRPTSENLDIVDIEKTFEYYSQPEQASILQMKCWKRADVFDIKSFGGHLITVPNPKLFPVKFINKHYPIRGAKHGIRKVRDERLNRYSPSELKKGWHSHYSATEFSDPKSMMWAAESLTHFDMMTERVELFQDALNMLITTNLFSTAIEAYGDKDLIIKFISLNKLCSIDHALEVYNVAKNLYELSTRYKLPPIDVSADDEIIIQYILNFFRAVDYSKGSLLNVKNSELIKLNVI